MDADLFLDSDAPLARRHWWTRLGAWLRALRLPRGIGTLKARLMLGSLLAMLAALALVTLLMQFHAEQGLLSQAEGRGRDEAERTAAALAHGVAELQLRVAQAIQAMPQTVVDDPHRAAATLASQVLPSTPLASVFFGHVGAREWMYADAAGTRQFETQDGDSSLAQRTIATGRPDITLPLQGRVTGEPVVALTVPLLRNGNVFAIAGASLRMASRDLVDDLLARSSFARSEKLRVTDLDGRMLSHRERARLLAPISSDIEHASGWSHWRAQGGNDSALAWSDDDAVRAVVQVPGLPWLVWVAQPREELLAPLAAAQRRVLADAAIVAGVFTLALGAFVGWQLRPLRRLERHAAGLLAGHAGGDWPQADGEIGRLARTLHHLWAERTQMESFNAQVMQKLGSVMAAAPVGLAFTRNQHFELVSEEMCRLLGHSEPDILGQRTQMIFVSNEDYAALGPQVAASFAQGNSYSGEWQLLRADGSRFWGLLRARPVLPGDAAAGTIWSLNDVSEQVAARRQLEHAAHHDALTGVVNRQGFELALQSLFESQPGSRPASLVMIDLDHFKPINDTAGHAAGDAMLVAVAQAIASRVRETDLVVRLGGDEFALLLAHCPHDRALVVAEKVRDAITNLSLTWEAHTLRVGASLGVAELGEHHESAAQWIAQADAACYEAKRQGRGRVRLARPDLRVVTSAGAA